jgi:P27 family predicted phage terminase small subunit
MVAVQTPTSLGDFQMGNPPKPNELKRAQGNPGKRPMKALATVTKIPQATAKAPEHLSPASQELWTRLRETAFWISNTDQSSLQLLCEKLDRRAEVIAKLQSSDFVLFTDKNYAYANPLVGMLSTIETEITKLFSLLGLTSTDRSRLGVAEVRVRSKLEELAQARQNKG